MYVLVAIDGVVLFAIADVRTGSVYVGIIEVYVALVVVAGETAVANTMDDVVCVLVSRGPSSMVPNREFAKTLLSPGFEFSNPRPSNWILSARCAKIVYEER